ncbi:MAG: phosphoglycerate dehydrogenase [Firmicutes bacterium]|nr:phosphoglycerate dehydrogenase [Bacillota bacterium]
MARPHILVTEHLGPQGLEYLAEHADVDAYDLLPVDQLPEMIGNYDAVIIRSAHRITRDLIENRPRIKVVARAGAGVDNVDLAACTEHGIVVVRAPGANAIAAAEHTFGLMLAVFRNIRTGDLHVREGGWNRQAFLGEELHGRRIGIIGLGRVGREVARIAHGFQMDVFAYDPFISEDIFTTHGATRMNTLEEMADISDVLTLHTPKNGPFLDKKLLQRLPHGAVYINAARGGLVDENALYELLQENHLRGVGLDVFSVEPPPRDFPLFNHPHVVFTPHLGGSTHEAMAKVGLLTAHGVIQALQGETPPNVVNIPVPPIKSEEFAALDEASKVVGHVFAKVHMQLPTNVIFSIKGHVPHTATPWLKQTVLAAILDGRVDERVNAVNAPLIAEQQGLKMIVEEIEDESTDAVLSLRWEGHPETTTEIAIENGQSRIKRLHNIPLDMAWPQFALVSMHEDRPGVVGKIGTIVGKHGVNIGNLHLGRTVKGREALMVLSLDEPAPISLVEELQSLPEINQILIFGE